MMDLTLDSLLLILWFTVLCCYVIKPCNAAKHWPCLQVLTACMKSFAHGANDTANAAGPFAAVQSLYLNLDSGCQGIGTPLWVLAFCGVGIVVVSSVMLYSRICSCVVGMVRNHAHNAVA